MVNRQKLKLHNEGGKKIVHPADAQRRKEKEKYRLRKKEHRKKYHTEVLLNKSPGEIQSQIQFYKELDNAGKLSKANRDRLQRDEAMFGKLKTEINERHQKRLAEPKSYLEVDFEELKSYRKYSVFYDSERNPWGAPPPGHSISYRHPDGSVRPEPPSVDPDVEPMDLVADGKKAASDDSDSDEEEDEPPMLPSSLPDGSLPASSFRSGMPPLPPGMPPLPAGMPQGPTVLPPLPAGMPPLPPGMPPLPACMPPPRPGLSLLPAGMLPLPAGVPPQLGGSTDLPPMPPGMPPLPPVMSEMPPMPSGMPPFAAGVPPGMSPGAADEQFVMPVGYPSVPSSLAGRPDTREQSGFLGVPAAACPTVRSAWGTAPSSASQPHSQEACMRPPNTRPPTSTAIAKGMKPKAARKAFGAPPPPPPKSKAPGRNTGHVAPPPTGASTFFVPTSLRTQKPRVQMSVVTSSATHLTSASILAVQRQRDETSIDRGGMDDAYRADRKSVV